MCLALGGGEEGVAFRGGREKGGGRFFLREGEGEGGEGGVALVCVSLFFLGRGGRGSLWCVCVCRFGRGRRGRF